MFLNPGLQITAILARGNASGWGLRIREGDSQSPLLPGATHAGPWRKVKARHWANLAGKLGIKTRGEGNKLHRLEAILSAKKQIRCAPACGACTQQLILVVNGLTQAKLVHIHRHGRAKEPR